MATGVAKLYRSVIDDVINNVRETFLDDGVDEQILLDIKATWERKLVESKAIEHKEQEKIGQDSASSSSRSNHNANSNQSRASNSRDNHRYQLQQQQQTTQQQQQQLQQQPQPQIVTQLQTQSSAPVQQQQQIAQTQAQVASQSHIIQGSGQSNQLSQSSSTLLTHAPGILQQGFVHITSGRDGKAVLMQNKVPMSLIQGSTTGGLITSDIFQHGISPNSVIHVGQTNSQTNAVNTGAANIHFQAANPRQTPTTRPQQPSRVIQLDGANDSSDDDDDDDEYRDNDDDHDDNDDDQNDEDNEYTGEEEVGEEPLNSEDDVSDEDPSELFDTDNVVVCQYDKITRSRNKWKFHLKDGIMNLQGKDYVFQKAIGDAEW